MIPEIQVILRRIAEGKTTSSKNKSGNEKLEYYFLMRMLNERSVRVGVKWQEIHQDAIDLELIVRDGKWSRITDNGSTFKSMIEDYETLTTDQKKFVLKNCILGNPKFSAINQFLVNTELNGPDGFEIYYEDWNELNRFSIRDAGIISELDIKMNDNKNKKYIIDKEFSEVLDDYKEGNDKEMSDSERKDQEKEQQRIGKYAEELAIKYERKFLEIEGHHVNKFDEENSPNKIIAIRNIRAGYDIKSFRNENSKNADKNIEVKGRKKKDPSFIISSGEVKKGIKYSRQKNMEHWIYFYYDLKHRKPSDFLPTAKIPFEDLEIKQCKNCLKYLVKIGDLLKSGKYKVAEFL